MFGKFLYLAIAREMLKMTVRRTRMLLRNGGKQLRL